MGDAHSVIADGDKCIFVLRADVDFEASAGIGVHDGIPEEIDEDLMEAFGVGLDPDVFLWECENELVSVFFDKRTDGPTGPFDHVWEGKCFFVDVKVAC